ncbi:hypothetical protein ACFQ0M_07910 [Kitasatospora aburaviensis]
MGRGRGRAAGREHRRKDADHERWADFYHDLALSFPDAAVLQGKRIVLDTGGRLVPAGGEHVFFPGTGDVLLQPDTLPARVREHLSFVHDQIPWSTGRGKVRNRRAAGRRWLEQQRLVQTYTPAALLPVLTAVMGQDGQDDETRWECLHLACRLWIAQGSRGGRIKGLLVPTREAGRPPGGRCSARLGGTVLGRRRHPRPLPGPDPAPGPLLRQAHDTLLRPAAEV